MKKYFSFSFLSSMYVILKIRKRTGTSSDYTPPIKNERKGKEFYWCKHSIYHIHIDSGV